MTRGTQSRRHRPELDGIRGIAILGVLIQHANIPSTVLAGTVGVNVFFVLSGYLITTILISEHAATGRVDLRAFYERRVRRLLPALVVMLLVVGLIAVIQGTFGPYLGQSAVSLFYVSDFAKAAGYEMGYLSQTWSLAVEEQFYILWPLLVLFMPRRFLVPSVLAGIATAVAMQLMVAGVQGNVLAMFRPDLRMDALLWGSLIGLVPVRVPRAVGYACLIGLIVLSVTFVWPVAMALSSVFAVGLVASAASMERILANRLLVRIGAISYGLYIWQGVPAGLLHSQIMSGDLGASVLVIVASIALALISERWIEEPFRRRRAGPEPSQSPALPTLRRVALHGAATELGAAPQRAPGFLRSEGLG